jgi:hypothetical protein
LSLMMTPSSPRSHEEINTDWLLVSPPPSKPMTSYPTPMHQQLLHQYLAQSEPPSTWLHRPIGLTTGSAQYMTMVGTSHSFYREFWKDTPTPILVRSHRRPSTNGWFMACSTPQQHRRT